MSKISQAGSTAITTTHLKINQAALVGIVAQIVGMIVALVPSWTPQTQLLIGVGTTAIVVAYLIANAVHAFGASKAPGLADLEGGLRGLVQDELDKVVPNGDIASVVQTALGGLLSAVAKPAESAPAAAPADVPPAPAATAPTKASGK